MRAPRMTIRRSMLLMVGVAVALRASTLAYRVIGDGSDRHVYHLWVQDDPPLDDRYVSMFGTQCYAPFWPRYWRALLGQCWSGTFKCPCYDPNFAKKEGYAEFYSIVGSRLGPAPSNYSVGSPASAVSQNVVDTWTSLTREYCGARKARSEP